MSNPVYFYLKINSLNFIKLLIKCQFLNFIYRYLALFTVSEDFKNDTVKPYGSLKGLRCLRCCRRIFFKLLCKTLLETFAKKPFPRQPKPKHRFSAVSLPQYLLILPKSPLNPPRTPHNRASAPPFRRQQAHLACWRLSTGLNTSPSGGFAHSLYTDQNRLPAHSGIYGTASRSSVRPRNGSSTNSGCVWFALPSADGCGRLCA